MYFTGKGGEVIREEMETWKDASGYWVARKGNQIVAAGSNEQEVKEELNKNLTFAKDTHRFRHE